MVMAFGVFTLNNQLRDQQKHSDRLEKALSQKAEKLQSLEAKLQEQNRTIQTLLSEKIKAEAYIEKLSKELEGPMSPLQVPNKSNITNENNRTRGIRG